MHRSVLVFLAGVLLGGLACAVGQDQSDQREPRYEDKAYKALDELIKQGDRLADDDRWTAGRDTAEWTAMEDRHRALLRDCVAFEEACRRQMEAQPSAVSHVFLYLWARGMHDGAIETVLGHELEHRGLGAAAGRTGTRYSARGRIADDGFMADFKQMVSERQ